MVQRLGGENEQLRRENERLARVIDSGDWGRQRVQELLEAGRVLQAERDALQKLVGSAAAATSCPAGGSGSSGAGCMAAGALGAEVPPLGDATNSPGAVPAMARLPSLAGSGEYEGGLLQRYRVSASGIQPAVAAAPASSGAAIPASWGGRAGGGRQATGSPRPTSPAARNKLLVGGGWWVQEAEARRVHHQILPAAEMQCCVLISMPRPTNLSSLLPPLFPNTGEERLLVQRHGAGAQARPGVQRSACTGHRPHSSVRS